jgi:hypothetical protein
MKKIFLKIKFYIGRIQYFLYKQRKISHLKDYSLGELISEFPSRNDVYCYMFNHFHNVAPREIRLHREYFSKEKRGFGEDAMHSMWWHIFRDFRPEKCLEIGVYRGQIISLWSLLAKEMNFSCEIHGISPFSESGDKVSKYIGELNYYDDVLKNINYFNLPSPYLLKAYSTEIKAINHIRGKKWDLIYIDGNHDYEVALSDYKLCRDSLANNGLLVMDDSSLYTDYNPPAFAFKGHTGPSRVVQELAMNDMKFIGSTGHNNIFQRK